MKEEIISNTAYPLRLEELYRLDPEKFSQDFNEAYDDIKEQPIAEFWRSRLHFEDLVSERGKSTEITAAVVVSPEKKFNLTFTIIAALLAGTLIRFPSFIGMFSENYILNNIAFFVLPLLCIYYIIKNKPAVQQIALFSGTVVISVLFMNLIPWEDKSDTRLLSSIHLAFMMWIFLGACYVGFDLSSREKQMLFIKRNGDVLILSAIIHICTMILLMLTAGLFSVIKVPIQERIFENGMIYGIAAAPIVANYMLESSPKMISKVAPFISKIFTPLILIAMTGFLIALAFFAKDPFNNREELIVFNILLVVNLAVIVFSFSGYGTGARSFNNKVLLALSIEAVIINSIALSAIVYRLFAMGVSPNRVAVLAGNILMFANLILIAVQMFRYIKGKAGAESINKSMTGLLPWYAVWAAIAAFTFPFLFWFK
jgi:hypothetical protein